MFDSGMYCIVGMKMCEPWHSLCGFKVFRAAKRLVQNVNALVNVMGVSLSFIFAQLWFLCAAVRPSIDEETWAASQLGKMNGKLQSCNKSGNSVKKNDPETGILRSSRFPSTHAHVISHPCELEQGLGG